MIDITVKTLDSQNHRYSVPDDITVKQFKERIASSVNIPPDKQRLIYCGRVLQDEKNLSEYNVHEKVIHLVMRAPPQTSSRGSDAGASSSDSGPRHHRGSHRSSRPDGRHVLFGSIVVPEDAYEDLTSTTTTRGPSSSGVRLQQARTMLERASEVLDQLQEMFLNSPEPSTSSSPNDKTPTEEASGVQVEDCSDDDEETGATGGSKKSKKEKKKDLKKGFDCNTDLHPPSSIPSDELENLYSEMDALNNTYNSIDAPMAGGSQMMGQMGNPFMGAISTSLAGGLAHAASAAFASALSSINNPTPSTSANVSSANPPNSTNTWPTPSESRFTSQTSQVTPSQLRNLLNMGATRTPTSVSNNATADNLTAASTATTTTTTTSAGSQSQNSVRGITVRITNRQPRSASIRLEHPRCNVMVEVLELYQDVQSRLMPFLSHYYRILANDQAYESANDRQLEADQYLLWRVSTVMHFVSHAMHAISDIIIDLRRNPPRQLRARPIIIPQPAIVQAQINVAANAEPGPRSRASPSAETRPPTSESSSASVETPVSPPATTSSSTEGRPTYAQVTRGLARNFMELDDGVVVMHVGPNGFTLDSLTSEGSNEDGSGNPPPELLQNLMSSLTSHFGMTMGGNLSPTGTPSSSAPGNSSPPSTPGAVRNPASMHNSQAAGNSGTNTTNSTQTRVTPRPHVHVTPLHVPGMGMTQFDPFLPCQSHHIRPSNTRRRNRQTNQASRTAMDSENQQSSETSDSTSSNNRQLNSSSGGSEYAEEFFSNLMANVLSENVSDELSEEQQQQEQFFAQLVRGVMAEVCDSLGARDRSGEERSSLQDFLEPFSGGGFFSDMERDNFFGQLFNTVSQSLSLGDLVQLFFGDAQRLNQLQEPLRQFILGDQVLRGNEPTEENIDRAIDNIILDLEPHITSDADGSQVNDGIDYVNTIHNFIRLRLRGIFNLILRTNEPDLFGRNLFSLLQLSFRELIAICLYCFSDGIRGLERLVESRVQSIMSGMRPAIQAWSVNTSLMQLRSMLSHLGITDDQIRQYIVSSDEDSQFVAATQNVTNSHSIAPISGNMQDDQENSDDNYVEAMDVDDMAEVEVTTSHSEGAVANEEPPVSVNSGSQSWHSAVPQDWIPVITRDVERQRRGIPDTNLSDAYLCGMPLKRRKIASQNKPHGSVQHVMQDTLRESMRTSGVMNRALVESLSGQASDQLGGLFADHIRSVLREQLENNQDFQPDQFPKSEQNIRKN